jgi:hypothetical protein
LIADGHNHISGGHAVRALARDQIEKHAHAEEPDDNAEHDANAKIFVT